MSKPARKKLAKAQAQNGKYLNLPYCFHALEEKRLDNSRAKQVTEYPEVITRLPEADIQFEGIRAWILQGAKHQLVFFEMETSVRVPEHCHDYDQWGIVIDGKMELTIDGKSEIFEKGHEYVIPAQGKHSARCLTKSRVMDFFSEKSRYRAKLP
jgi:quercetin dioxygenase-like cupin family protein